MAPITLFNRRALPQFTISSCASLEFHTSTQIIVASKVISYSDRANKINYFVFSINIHIRPAFFVDVKQFFFKF